MPDPLTRIPESFYAGDTLQWKVSYSDFPSTAWEMEVTFGPADTTARAMIQIASDGGSPAIAKNSDGSFTASIRGATSDLFFPETDYHFNVAVRDGTDRYTVERGRILAKRNLDVNQDAGGTHDLRSTVKQTLDQIRDRIQGRSLLDQNSMSIGNRAVSRMSAEELVRWEAIYAVKYEHEVRAEKIRRGLKTSRSVKVRFMG